MNPQSAIHHPQSLLRRRAMRLGYVNGVLWSIGNGLTSGSLVLYLLMELGAQGLELSLLLAAPAVFGLLRLAAPAIIRACGGPKITTIRVTLASYLLMIGLPLMAIPNSPLSASQSLVPLITLVCVHQLLEYVGTVALWTWWADLIPRRIRGRYFSRRQIMQLAVLIPTLAFSGAFIDRWVVNHPRDVDPEMTLVGYAITTAVGVIALLTSLVPLVHMPATIDKPRTTAPSATFRWATFLAPFRDPAFAGVLLFGCWVSFFNGITQGPQSFYVKNVLGVSLLALAALRIAMQLGQMAMSLGIGPMSDRYGNRPVLVACQWLLGIAPLFFLLASPAEPIWVLGTYLAWSAYAGPNICMPNLVLRMAGSRDPSSYVAAYFAATSLIYGIATVVGGQWFDRLAAARWTFEAGGMRLDHFGLLFMTAWIARTSAVGLVMRIREPGAWTWRQILGGNRSGGAATAATIRPK